MTQEILLIDGKFYDVVKDIDGTRCWVTDGKKLWFYNGFLTNVIRIKTPRILTAIEFDEGEG